MSARRTSEEEVAALMSSPPDRDRIIALLSDHISADEVDAIVALGTPAIGPASLLATRLRRPMAYIRARQKEHGKQRRLEGVCPQEQTRALVLLPSLTDTQVLREGVSIVEGQGAVVSQCVDLSEFVSQALDRGGSNGTSDAEQFLLSRSIKHIRPSPVPRGSADVTDRQKPVHDPNRTASSPDSIERSVARGLLEIDAVTVNRAKPYLYASGLYSPIYTDNRLLISHPDEWQTVIEGFIDVITTLVGLQNVDGLAGTATAGIPHASLVADRLGLPMIYVDGEQVVGDMPSQSNVVIIEDLVTTGASAIASAEVLRKNKLRADWCLAIFTYNHSLTNSRFNERQIQFNSLCKLPTLLEVGIEMGRIDQDAREAVLQWLADPQGWSDRLKAQRAAT
jgi:orotate phosphoribosyltransferase